MTIPYGRHNCPHVINEETEELKEKIAWQGHMAGKCQGHIWTQAVCLYSPYSIHYANLYFSLR